MEEETEIAKTAAETPADGTCEAEECRTPAPEAVADAAAENAALAAERDALLAELDELRRAVEAERAAAAARPAFTSATEARSKPFAGMHFPSVRR